MIPKTMAGWLVVAVLILCVGEVISLKNQIAAQKRENAQLTLQVQKLASKIQFLTQPPQGGVVPISDIFAVPENYLDKSVTVDGVLYADSIFTNPKFSGDVGALMLSSPTNHQLLMICAFDQSLDPSFRELIATLHNGSAVLIEGQLVSIDKNALFSKVGWGVNFRDGIIISRIFEKKPD